MGIDAGMGDRWVLVVCGVDLAVVQQSRRVLCPAGPNSFSPF